MRIFGILNLTSDSFSDGGRYLDLEPALQHAAALRAAGADVIDIGAAASNPASKRVEPDEQIARLAPVLEKLRACGMSLSVDSSATPVQRYALACGVEYLNDVGGFSDPEAYSMLASATAKLVVVHSMTGDKAAPRITAPGEVGTSLRRFFDRRVGMLLRAGVPEERLVLDPGMGLFLGRGAHPSIEALRAIQALKRAYGLPVMVSVSRKSFLGDITGRDVAARGAATLAAEIFALEQGCDYIRTHDPGALRDADAVLRALGHRGRVDLN